MNDLEEIQIHRDSFATRSTLARKTENKEKWPVGRPGYSNMCHSTDIHIQKLVVTDDAQVQSQSNISIFCL